MGKNKLKKFSEMENFSCVMQYPREKLLAEGFPFKGKWNEVVFPKNSPITLELGCGKGEYTIGLSTARPDRNHVGIDIKGARMWSGAREAEEKGIENARFLRTEIENIASFFGPCEVDEIWITFPDPQMQKKRKRLLSPRFLEMYRAFLKPGGRIHLKTDSPFLFEYTRRLVELNDLKLHEMTSDLYGEGKADEVSAIKTYYESQWLDRGKKIKLISFEPHSEVPLMEPAEDDIPKDDYRAYPRHQVALKNEP